MTFADALAKGHAQLDEASVRILADAEATLRHHGASDEEVGLELARLRQDLDVARSRMVAILVCGWAGHSTWVN